MFRYGLRGQDQIVTLDGEGKVDQVIARSSPGLPVGLSR
jgi:hypothetical protein